MVSSNDDGDDDDDASPLSSLSLSPQDSDDEEAFQVIDAKALLRSERELLSRHRAPVSDRGLNPDASSFESPFHRNAVAECIKESSRSENDFVYLNNLYTFSAARKSSMESLAASLAGPAPLGPSKRKEQSRAHSSESTSKLKGLQKHRTAEEELEYERLLKREKGFEIKRMLGDGNCLFRSVADQLFGDQERHAQVRRDCMAYSNSFSLKNGLARYIFKLAIISPFNKSIILLSDTC